MIMYVIKKEHETHVHIENEPYGDYVVIEQPESSYGSNQSIWLSFKQCEELIDLIKNIIETDKQGGEQ